MGNAIHLVLTVDELRIIKEAMQAIHAHMDTFAPQPGESDYKGYQDRVNAFLAIGSKIESAYANGGML